MAIVFVPMFHVASAETSLPGEPAVKPAIAPDPFPDTLSAYVWRNWFLVPKERLAKVSAQPSELTAVAVEMGLPPEPVVLPEWRRRGYITVLRRNWHLLPYPQMLELLEMTRDQLAFSLMEDDFLWVKLGRIGYESSNHYFYTVPDIIEKVLSCRAVLDSVKTSE